MSRTTALLRTALLRTALAAVVVAVSTTALAGPAALRDRGARDRGDVPGWVLVTVMTAGIVVGLAAIATPTLTQMFQQAITAVKAP